MPSSSNARHALFVPHKVLCSTGVAIDTPLRARGPVRWRFSFLPRAEEQETWHEARRFRGRGWRMCEKSWSFVLLWSGHHVRRCPTTSASSTARHGSTPHLPLKTWLVFFTRILMYSTTAPTKNRKRRPAWASTKTSTYRRHHPPPARTEKAPHQTTTRETKINLLPRLARHSAQSSSSSRRTGRPATAFSHAHLLTCCSPKGHQTFRCGCREIAQDRGPRNLRVRSGS